MQVKHHSEGGTSSTDSRMLGPLGMRRIVVRAPSRARTPTWRGSSARLHYCPPMPLNRKAGNRRLVDMSAVAELADRAWEPDLPAVDFYVQSFLIGEAARYIQRLDYDERERLVEWAVIQLRLRNGRWLDVALYDTCHGKGVHKHLFNRQGDEFTEVSLRPITSYQDVEDGLDWVLDQLAQYYRENERRSDRGY